MVDQPRRKEAGPQSVLPPHQRHHLQGSKSQAGQPLDRHPRRPPQHLHRHHRLNHPNLQDGQQCRLHLYLRKPQLLRQIMHHLSGQEVGPPLIQGLSTPIHHLLRPISQIPICPHHCYTRHNLPEETEAVRRQCPLLPPSLHPSLKHTGFLLPSLLPLHPHFHPNPFLCHLPNPHARVGKSSRLKITNGDDFHHAVLV